MKRLKCVKWLVPLVLLLASFPAAAQDDARTNAVWENQRGSYLHITAVTPEGMIAGFFVNNAPNFQCRGTPYPLIGWIAPGTNTITFSVMWKNGHANCRSLTTWAGVFSGDSSRITTTWLLVFNGQQGAPMQGQDTFTRRAATEHPSVLPPGNQD